MSVFGVIRNLTIAAFVALALVAVAANIKLPVGYRVLVVQSGSMEPAIPVGSVLLTKPTADFAAPLPIQRFLKGDIITYSIGKNNFVSHRVVGIQEKAGAFFYQTKGDANKEPDQKLIPESEVVGRAALTVPYVGRFVNFAKTPLGYFLMIVIPSLYVILSETWAIISEIRKSRVRISPSGAGIALPIALIFVTSIYFVGGTAAYFSDTANSTNNVFTAAESFGPPIAQTLVVNEFLWDSSCGNNASQEAANYWIELYNGSAQTVDLKDWRFKDANGATIQISNAQKLLNSGEYIVISKSGSVFTGNPPCYTLQGDPEQANLGGSSDFLPATTGGVITLEKPVGETFEVVDRIEYGPSQNGGVLDTPEDQSIARTPNGVDSALGNTFDPDDFVVDTTPSVGVSN